MELPSRGEVAVSSEEAAVEVALVVWGGGGRGQVGGVGPEGGGDGPSTIIGVGGWGWLQCLL